MSADAGLEKVFIAQTMSDQLALTAMNYGQAPEDYVNDGVAIGIRLFEVAEEHKGTQLGFMLPDRPGYSMMPLEIIPPSDKPGLDVSELVELPVRSLLLSKIYEIADRKNVHHADVAATTLYWHRGMLAAQAAERTVKLIVPQPDQRQACFGLGWAGISL